MPQEFHVLRCCVCGTFQVHQVKKAKKWDCKLCGQKQSIIKVFGRGTGADCRRHVQKLNMLRGQMDQMPSADSCHGDDNDGSPNRNLATGITQSTFQNPDTSSQESKWTQYVGSEPPPGEDTDNDCHGYTTSRVQYDGVQKRLKQNYRDRGKGRFQPYGKTPQPFTASSVQAQPVSPTSSHGDRPGPIGIHYDARSITDKHSRKPYDRNVTLASQSPAENLSFCRNENYNKHLSSSNLSLGRSFCSKSPDFVDSSFRKTGNVYETDKPTSHRTGSSLGSLENNGSLRDRKVPRNQLPPKQTAGTRNDNVAAASKWAKFVDPQQPDEDDQDDTLEDEDTWAPSAADTCSSAASSPHQMSPRRRYDDNTGHHNPPHGDCMTVGLEAARTPSDLHGDSMTACNVKPGPFVKTAGPMFSVDNDDDLDDILEAF